MLRSKRNTHQCARTGCCGPDVTPRQERRLMRRRERTAWKQELRRA